MGLLSTQGDNYRLAMRMTGLKDLNSMETAACESLRVIEESRSFFNLLPTQFCMPPPFSTEFISSIFVSLSSLQAVMGIQVVLRDGIFRQTSFWVVRRARHPLVSWIGGGYHTIDRQEACVLRQDAKPYGPLYALRISGALWRHNWARAMTLYCIEALRRLGRFLLKMQTRRSPRSKTSMNILSRKRIFEQNEMQMFHDCWSCQMWASCWQSACTFSYSGEFVRLKKIIQRGGGMLQTVEHLLRS